MSNLTGSSRASYVREMFVRIAPRYDLLNSLITLGRDASWRVDTVHCLDLNPGQQILDIGTGTGDLAAEILQQEADIHVVACDFTHAMIEIGRNRHQSSQIDWVIGDAEHLPFSSACFDGIVSGFLLRNLGDLKQSLEEQARVLKTGGRFAALETSPPKTGFINPLIAFYYKYIIPSLGRIFAGSKEAYEYLPDSTEGFLTADELSSLLSHTGFSNLNYIQRMFGSIAIHWGRKK